MADAHDNPCPNIDLTISDCDGRPGVLRFRSDRRRWHLRGLNTFSDTVGTETISASISDFSLSAQVTIVPPAWSAISPEGGSVSRLVFDPTNSTTAYAVTAMGGIYKTTDGATDWVPIDEGWSLPPALACGEPDRVRSDRSGGLWAISTFLRGRWRWRNVPAPRPVRPSSSIRPSRHDLRELLHRPAKSTDRGSTWIDLTTVVGGIQMSALAFDPNDPSTMYAIQGGSVWTSTDRGANWTAPANSGLGALALGARLVVAKTTPTTIYAFDTTGIWRSTTAAASWTALSPPSTGALNLASSATTPSHSLPVTTSGLYLSTTAAPLVDAHSAGERDGLRLSFTDRRFRGVDGQLIPSAPIPRMAST